MLIFSPVCKYQYQYSKLSRVSRRRTRVTIVNLCALLGTAVIIVVSSPKYIPWSLLVDTRHKTGSNYSMRCSQLEIPPKKQYSAAAAAAAVTPAYPSYATAYSWDLLLVQRGCCAAVLRVFVCDVRWFGERRRKSNRLQTARNGTQPNSATAAPPPQQQNKPAAVAK